jgi:hypothetical protein
MSVAEEKEARTCKYGFLLNDGGQSESNDFRCHAYSPAPEESADVRDTWAALLGRWGVTSTSKVSVCVCVSGKIRRHPLLPTVLRTAFVGWGVRTMAVAGVLLTEWVLGVSQIEAAVRSGIPIEHRGEAWTKMLKIDEMREGAEFTYAGQLKVGGGALRTPSCPLLPSLSPSAGSMHLPHGTVVMLK